MASKVEGLCETLTCSGSSIFVLIRISEASGADLLVREKKKTEKKFWIDFVLYGFHTAWSKAVIMLLSSARANG